jgi:hypothetical protein
MNIFPDTYDLPKLIKEEIKNLNKLTKNNQVEAVINRFPHKSPKPHETKKLLYS